MAYVRLSPGEFYRTVATEAAARRLVWRVKFGDKDFQCPECQNETFYEFENKPEIRKCRKCRRHVRLRAGTIFEHSKIPILIWVEGIFQCMQGSRGVSALELQRILKMPHYETTWVMLHKIREALRQRDLKYKLSKYIELDGATLSLA